MEYGDNNDNDDDNNNANNINHDNNKVHIKGHNDDLKWS